MGQIKESFTNTRRITPTKVVEAAATGLLLVSAPAASAPHVPAEVGTYVVCPPSGQHNDGTQFRGPMSFSIYDPDTNIAGGGTIRQGPGGLLRLIEVAPAGEANATPPTLAEDGSVAGVTLTPGVDKDVSYQQLDIRFDGSNTVFGNTVYCKTTGRKETPAYPAQATP